MCVFWFICGVGEKGKFTVNPAKGGAAEKAGVRKGDRLIWMDGAMTSELTHSAISKMVSKELHWIHCKNILLEIWLKNRSCGYQKFTTI